MIPRIVFLEKRECFRMSTERVADCEMGIESITKLCSVV